MSTYWGEIPSLQDADSGIAALVREQMTKPRPMEVEGPPLHQPSQADATSAALSQPPEAFVLDGLTLHTIRLVQFARKLRAMILHVHQQCEQPKSSDGEEKEVASFPVAPPVPEYNGPELKHKLLKPLPYLPNYRDSAFCRGLGPAPPEVDTRTCRNLLRRSVAAVAAHAGYDNCGELILETLTDVSHEYLLQMTQLLRRAVDSEATRGGGGFPDAVEQVFHEMGIGSPLVLHDFYQSRVLEYHTNMEQTCHKLVQEYNLIRNPEVKVDDIKPIVRSKEEPVSDIQFPVLEEEDTTEGDQVIHLEGLGLDINIVNEPSSNLNIEEDGGKWSQGSARSETNDNFMLPVRPARRRLSILALIRRRLLSKVKAKKMRALDAYDPDSTPTGDGISSTMIGSESDPGSVSVSDIMSPPSTGLRTGKPPSKKRKK